MLRILVCRTEIFRKFFQRRASHSQVVIGECHQPRAWFLRQTTHYHQTVLPVLSTVAEGYNGFQPHFSKFAGEIFDCDCNVQLSTAIQLFNTDSLFQLPQRNRYFQRSTAIETFNHDSDFNAQLRFQLSTTIQSFNAQLRSQLSTVIQFFKAQVRLKL